MCVARHRHHAAAVLPLTQLTTHRRAKTIRVSVLSSRVGQHDFGARQTSFYNMYFVKRTGRAIVKKKSPGRNGRHHAGDPSLPQSGPRTHTFSLLARQPRVILLTRVILLAAVTYPLHSRYIAIKVGIKGRKGPPVMLHVLLIVCLSERSALALQEPQKPRKMDVFAIFFGPAAQCNVL